ncbi:hypothetical protein QQ045_025484 [Rhodiola kirilowii]
MGCCFCHSFSSSKLGSNSPISNVYISPLPKSALSEVYEAQPPPAPAEIQPVSNSISLTREKIQIGDDDKGIRRRVHFASKVVVLDEDVRSELTSFEADSKQSSGEGESHESLFSLQLVDGWRTENEEEVMSKEINSSNVSRALVEHLTENEDEEITLPAVIQLKGQNEESEQTNSMSGAANDDSKGESGEVSADISLSSWLVEPENNIPMSRNVVKCSITEKRRVLGELSLVEVNQNPGQGQSSKNSLQGAADSDMYCYGSSMENVKQEIRKQRISLPKHDQKVDLQKAIPLGLSLARAAMCTGVV